ncbi:hypothetical protein GWI33_016878 [Rhynchophorus ferrugineus]|uniref:Uncharacterized protein n=1 Tax=Rhynchophorus ferrugineus TaxID=354439 RepID=A0A834HZ95_RHYFE|nr:hypothetical protein GWI33_016878 [Rhynchophorus ferrugineus]
MKKLLKTPNKIVRRVLSRTSHKTDGSRSSFYVDDLMLQDTTLAEEIRALKQQVEHLKSAISALSRDTEKKEVALARIAREKEVLSLDLLKQKRSNSSLLKQLEDERKHYYQEKEQYCAEMNEIKKLKKALSTTSTHSDAFTIEQYKQELSKTKLTLNHTLQANYNLSIKFLRMKNTKTCLKTQLKSMQLEHEKIVNEYKTKIENLCNELGQMIHEKIVAPISCSSKKYLQLVNQNSCLVYENLCLQLEVDQLNSKLEKMKLEKLKDESNSKLNYIYREKPKPKTKPSSNQHKKVRIKEEKPEKDVTDKPSTSKSSEIPTKENILKIFERVEQPGVPKITILHDTDPSSKPSTSRQHEPVQIPSIQEKSSRQSESKQTNLIKNIADNPNPRLALFQVSETTSRTSTTVSGGLTRTTSSPNLLFRNAKHYS